MRDNEENFLTLVVVRYNVSRTSSSSADLLNGERSLILIVRTRHLQRRKRGNRSMNFTAIKRVKQITRQELSHALVATKSIVEKLILIKVDAGVVCMQMGDSVRVQQKVRVITPSPRGAELKVPAECSMHEPYTNQMGENEI